MSDELKPIRDRINRVASFLREEQSVADKRYAELFSEIHRLDDTIKKQRDRIYRLELRLRRRKG